MEIHTREFCLKRELPILFKAHFGCDFEHVKKLPGAGSNRAYYRVSAGERSAIFAIGDDLGENRAFCTLSEILLSHGLPVPEILGIGENSQCYLQQDLGDKDLLSMILSDSDSDLPERVMRNLAVMNALPVDDFKNAVAFDPFGERLVMFDLNYFKYDFLKPLDILYDENALQDDFERLCADILCYSDKFSGFMMRDCQSRNIMVADNTPYFIDFQGGRVGPGIYDAVSFIWQAKAGFSEIRRCELLNVYAQSLSALKSISAEEVIASADIFVLLRTLQVLGAYGFRGIIERKAHFIESIPAAIHNLEWLAKRGTLDCYSQLKRISVALSDDRRFKKEDAGRLTVSVFSFSYKKGYPQDFSGNGGGFMFDCRGMHNPGRYTEYKTLTGLDKPVKDFLEERGEVQEFLKSVYHLTDHSIETYIRRGFSSLQIGFGCTGGQHRSVYCAQATADHIRHRFPQVNVELLHREQKL